MQQTSGRASLSNYGRRRRCCREEGGARASGAQPPTPAPLYIGALEGGRAQPCPFLQGRGAAKRGGRSPSSPRHLGGAFPPLDSPLSKFPWRMGPWGWFPLAQAGQGAPPKAHVAHQGRWPHLVDPRDPSGGPGTIPITPKLVPMAETALPIYNSLPPDHSGTPRDVRDLIRDSEQHSGYCTYISSQP